MYTHGVSASPALGALPLVASTEGYVRSKNPSGILATLRALNPLRSGKAVTERTNESPERCTWRQQ
jgi:hypothetical protein